MALKMRAARRDLVVHEQAALAFDVADHRHRLRPLVIARAPLVDDRDGQVEAPGEVPGILGLTHVGGDHHRARHACLAQPLAQHRDRRELIGRHREEALDLGRVQVHGQHAVGPRGGQQIGHEAGGDGDPRLVFLVAARVREVRQDCGHPPRRGVP